MAPAQPGSTTSHQSGRASLKHSARVGTIALSRESAAALSQLRKSASPVHLLVFPATNGRPERLQHLDQLCEGLCKAAGIKRHNPSDLRHTAISVALAYAKEAEGISYANVSAWAGHASVSITIDNYLHMLPAGPGSIAAWGQLQRAPLTGT
jgi:integrase